MHRSEADGFAIAAYRVAQAIVERLRIQEGFDERLAVTNRKLELPVLRDGASCGVLDAGQHEVRDRPPLQGRGMFDERLLIRRHPRLEAVRANAAARGLRDRLCHVISPPGNVRPIPDKDSLMVVKEQQRYSIAQVDTLVKMSPRSGPRRRFHARTAPMKSALRRFSSRVAAGRRIPYVVQNVPALMFADR